MPDPNELIITRSFGPADENAVFALARHMRVEYFEGSALLLDLRTQLQEELDTRQGSVLRYVDGQRTLGQVAKDYAAANGLNEDQAIEIVEATCEKLAKSQVLELVRGTWKGGTMNEAHYVQNPDVNLREEDEDGALLFNPDADRVELINGIGLFIWKLCARGNTIAGIVAALEAEFEGVPEDQVATDVEEFISQMVSSGFLGTVQPF